MRYALLIILLIPCWVIAFQYHVDLRTVAEVLNLIPSSLSQIYQGKEGPGRFYYGPVTLVFYQFLKPFSYNALQVVWLSLQTMAFGIFWFCIQKLYPFLLERRYWILWIFVFLFAVNPIHNNFQSGNIQLMLIAALLLAEVSTYQDTLKADLSAGVLVALAAAVKVFPLYIVAYYVLVKSRRVWAGLALGFALSVAAPFLAFGYQGGTELFQGFIRNLFVYQNFNPFLVVPDILCLPSLLARIGITGFTSKALLAVVASFFFGAVLAQRKSIRTKPSVAHHYFALALAVMTLINPSTRVHYFIFFVPAFCSLLELREQITPMVFAVFALIALTTQGVLGKTLNDRLEMWNVPTWGFILLIVATAVSLKAFSACKPNKVC